MKTSNRHHKTKFNSGLIYNVNDDGGVPDISSIIPLVMTSNHIPIVSGEAGRLFITLTGPLRLFRRVLPCNHINSRSRFIFIFLHMIYHQSASVDHFSFIEMCALAGLVVLCRFWKFGKIIYWRPLPGESASLAQEILDPPWYG